MKIINVCEGETAKAQGALGLGGVVVPGVPIASAAGFDGSVEVMQRKSTTRGSCRLLTNDGSARGSCRLLTNDGSAWCQSEFGPAEEDGGGSMLHGGASPTTR